ncbi:LacI family DNA-binding transcriptional regulator [Clostridium thermarum]|uniref:LacI family DNA-binding transcriptional regulator n=1 Tax=Clostridium thermarum TaxID=1716543 RepID=UPI0013D277A6|nr:LacI family DNA-binding transcriptional regulator [Clostridium thermarum]
MAVTINDIANRAGVSLATVSRVINDSGYVSAATRKKVLQAIEELDFTPNGIARSLSKNETNTIGIVVPDITNSYFGEIIKGISEIAESKDLNIILFNTDDNINKELRALKLLKAQRIKGIIMTPGFGEEDLNSEYINTLENIDVPLVLAAASVKYAKLNGVFVDDTKGAFDATNHLIKEGHTKIGIITGGLNSKPSVDRLMGYKKAMAFSKLPVEESFIYHGDYRMEKAYTITKEILEKPDGPTALVICSNMMTLGAVRAIHDSGKKIPEDLALIGFDKIQALDLLGFNISYVDDFPVELGKEAANMLLELVEQEDNKGIKEVTISPTVVLKGSEKYLK